MESQQKIALITGATRGIGQAIMLSLAAQGHYVVGTATSDEGVETINGSIKQGSFSGHGACLDVSSPSSIETFFGAISDTCGMPDILINNAGITRDNLLLRMKEEEWQQVISTNLTSIYRLSKTCLKSMMKKRWGRIISMASVTGLMGNPGQANYCAAKAGVIGFSKSLAREVASRNITVNVIAPGFIQSDMTDKLSPEQKEGLMAMIPVGFIGQPADIAAGVVYLSSEGASFVTGETLNINGGMFMG